MNKTENPESDAPKPREGRVFRRKSKAKVKATQSCPTLCNPMDYTVQEFSRPEY